MRFWDEASDEVKAALLWSCGMRDPRQEALECTSRISLTMWGEFLRHGLTLIEGMAMQFIPSEFVRAFWDADHVIHAVEQGELGVSVAALGEMSKRQGTRLRVLN